MLELVFTVLLMSHTGFDCTYIVSVVETPGFFEIRELIAYPKACVSRAALGDNGWIRLQTPRYDIMIQLPADAKSGYLTYHEGQGIATWNDGKKRKLEAFMFLKEEI